MDELLKRQFKTLIGTAMDAGVSDYDIIEWAREAIETWKEVHPEVHPEDDDEEAD